ncbi:MAG: hypothetical protein FWG36_09370 [Oscillospiraceae bacterium]|nr:hypothetical protein [Oscillospiraceae bacterium]
MSVKTIVFLAVMSLYLASLLFLTYYSKQVYQKNLPVVTAVMPERGERLDNGRYSYIILTEAIRINPETGMPYVLVLKEANDVLGLNYFLQSARVIVHYMDDEYAVVDGFVYIEPIALSDDPRVNAGVRVRVKEEGEFMSDLSTVS